MSRSPSSEAEWQPLLRMPLHLLVMVLSELDDMQSLGSAIRSHSLLYAAYRDDTNAVLKSILRNQIPSGLMRYAVTAYDARYISRDSKEAMDELLIHSIARGHDRRGTTFQERFLKSRIENNTEAPMLAAALSRTHSIVEHFCSRFLADTLPLAPKVFGTVQSASAEASENEVFRVQRALYRFQAYCNLGFRDDYNDGLGGDLKRWWSSALRGCQQEAHFRAFSPWVNEQLACIHDYLERVLSRSFDEVASRDMEWGARKVNWLLTGKDNTRKQAYLSYGLNFLFLLDRAEGYEQRSQLLKSKGFSSTTHFLATYLPRGAPQDICRCCPPGMYPLADYRRWTRGEVERVLRARDTDGPDDLDSGPFDMWWYVHKHSFVQDTVFQDKNSSLRRYGYVIWDAPEVLDRDKVRSCVDVARQNAASDLNEVRTGGRKHMEHSWQERTAIYKEGGRGYWREADSIQVTWAYWKKNTTGYGLG